MDLLLENYVVVYGALVSIVMYLSSFIPFFNRISDMVLRSVAIAVVLAVAFFTTGLGGSEMIFAFVAQAWIYDNVLEPKGLKTKK